MAEPAEASRPHPLRNPCKRCGGSAGTIRPTGFNDCLYCDSCALFQYNVPKTESGRASRTVRSVHSIAPSQRSRILFDRAGGKCEICGRREDLQVGHMISVADGMAQGMTDAQINDDANLCAMCAECNLGLGSNPVPLWLAIGLAMARIKRGQKL